jgi:hypothetical protein
MFLKIKRIFKMKKMVQGDYNSLSMIELFYEKIRITERLENSFKDMNNFVSNIEESFVISENEKKFGNLEKIFEGHVNDANFLNNFLTYNAQINILSYGKKHEELRVEIDNKNSEYIKNECEKIREGKTEKQLLKMMVVPEEVPYSVPVVIMSNLKGSIKEDY